MNKDKVIFFKDSHTYWFNGVKFSSVGKYMDQFFPKFDEEFWLTHGVLKNKFGDEYSSHYGSFKTMMPEGSALFSPFIERMGVSEFINNKEDLRMKWELKRNTANFFGTKFHSMMEDKALKEGSIVNPWDSKRYDLHVYEKLYDNESICLNLYDLPDGCYTELLIFNLDIGVAGQSDEVFIRTVGKKRIIDINDHKTNEKLPAKSDMNRCYAPFEKEYASTHFKYTVQINLYALMLSKFGFEIGNLAYTHYKDYDPVKKTRVDVENIQKKLNKVVFP